jgi:hypothetical protein
MDVADTSLYVFGKNTVEASDTGEVPPFVMTRKTTESVVFSVNPVIKIGEKVFEAETKDWPFMA